MKEQQAPTHQGFAGWLATAFVESRLTLIGIAASLLLGFMAITMLPREEEPQIKVPQNFRSFWTCPKEAHWNRPPGYAWKWPR